jgi:hypothetical protein
VERLLDGEHDLRPRRVDVGREVPDEVVLREPGEALVVDDEIRERGRRIALPEESPIDSPSSGGHDVAPYECPATTVGLVVIFPAPRVVRLTRPRAPVQRVHRTWAPG